MKSILPIFVILLFSLSAFSQNTVQEQRVKAILNPTNFRPPNLPLLMYDGDGRTLVTKDFNLLPIQRRLMARWVKDVKVVRVHKKKEEYTSETIIIVKLKENCLDSIPYSVKLMFQ